MTTDQMREQIKFELHLQCERLTKVTGKIHYILGFKDPEKVVMCNEFFPASDNMKIHYIYFPERPRDQTSDTADSASDSN